MAQSNQQSIKPPIVVMLTIGTSQARYSNLNAAGLAIDPSQLCPPCFCSLDGGQARVSEKNKMFTLRG